MPITKIKTNNKRLIYKEENSLPFLCYDTVIKAIFTDEVNILAKMVSDITGIAYEVFKDNIILQTNELPISTSNEKAKRCDFILRIDKDHIFNLEINTSKYDGGIIKNLAYICHIFATETKRGEMYNENLKALQININCYDNNYDKPLAEYLLQEKENHQVYTKNLSIFALNVVKCSQIYYNRINKEDIPKYIRWGALIYCKDFSEIPNIVKGIMTDEERDRIMDKINKLTHDDIFMTELEARKAAEWEERSKLNYARKEGIAEGIEQGIEQEKIATIKNMVTNKATLEFISKVTGKTIEEIKEIINE